MFMAMKSLSVTTILTSSVLGNRCWLGLGLVLNIDYLCCFWFLNLKSTEEETWRQNPLPHLLFTRKKRKETKQTNHLPREN